MPAPGGDVDKHGPHCVSPPVGEEIRTQAPSGESIGLSVNVVRAASWDQPGAARSTPNLVRLLVEAEPGFVTGCLLDRDAAIHLMREVSLAIELHLDA
jgi:hypothetical protein